MGDTVIAETYRHAIAFGGDEVQFALVTHNKHDFSDMATDERQPHPDFKDLFESSGSAYWLSLGECLYDWSPEHMDDIK